MKGQTTSDRTGYYTTITPERLSAMMQSEPRVATEIEAMAFDKRVVFSLPRLFKEQMALNIVINDEIKKRWPVGCIVEFPRVLEKNLLMRGRVDGHKKQGGVGHISLIVIDETTGKRVTKTVSIHNYADIKRLS